MNDGLRGLIDRGINTLSIWILSAVELLLGMIYLRSRHLSAFKNVFLKFPLDGDEKRLEENFKFKMTVIFNSSPKTSKKCCC
jgi:hypothetical protein